MKRALTIAALVCIIGAGARLFTAGAAAQTAEDVIAPGCDIPTSYGRLVNVLPGQPGGPGAGVTYAIFEAPDAGKVRWVAASPSGNVMNKTGTGPAFIPKYECSLAFEWSRH